MSERCHSAECQLKKAAECLWQTWLLTGGLYFSSLRDWAADEKTVQVMLGKGLPGRGGAR